MFIPRYLLFLSFVFLLFSGFLAKSFAAEDSVNLGNIVAIPFVNNTHQAEFDWLSIALQESLTLDLWYLPIGSTRTLLQYQENIAKHCPVMKLACVQKLQLSDWKKIAKRKGYQTIFWGNYTLDNKAVFHLQLQLWNVVTGEKIGEQTVQSTLTQLPEKMGLALLTLLNNQGFSISKKQEERVLHAETKQDKALKANALGYWAQQQYALAKNDAEKQRLEQLWQQQLQKAVHLDPNYANAWNNLGWYFATMQSKKRIERKQAFQQALKANADHPDARDGLGNLYSEEGDYQQAFTLLKPLPTLAPSMLHRYLSLMRLYEATGDKEKELVLMGKQLLLLNDRDSAKSLTQLGIRHYKRGEYQQALPLLKHSVAIYKQQSDIDYPAMTNSLTALAVLYKKIEKYKKAEVLYKQVLSIHKRYVDIEHDETARTQNNLGLLYQELGRYKEAKSLLQQALKTRRKRFPADHLEVANSLNNLALLYVSLFHYDKAKPLYKQALAIREQQLDKDDPEIATSLNNLAELYHLIGNNPPIEAMLQRALMIRQEKLGKDHPDTVSSVNSLALFYESMGDFVQAERLYQHVLHRYKKKFGEESSYTAIALNNLALFYKTMGRYNKAETLHKHALSICKKTFGEKYLRCTISMNNLGLLYQAMRQYDQAEPLLQQALMIRQQQLGEQHITVATSRNNLAVLYQAIGQFERAESLFQHSLTLCQQQLGENHPRTAMSLNNLAKLYQKTGRFNKAKRLHQQALIIQGKQVGDNNPYLNLTMTLSDYSWSLKQQQHSQAAIFFAKLAVNSLQLSRQKNRKLPKALKSSFIGKNELIYRALVEWLFDAHRLQEAEHVMAMYKEKEVADYFRKSPLDKVSRPATLLRFTAKETKWYTAYQQLTHNIHKTFRAYQQIKEKTPALRNRKEQQQLKQLTIKLLKNEHQFEMFFDHVIQSQQKTLQAKAIAQAPNALQKTLAQLDKGTAVLSYFVQDDKVRMLLTTTNKRILRESTITAKELRQLIQDYRIQLKQIDQIRQLSQTLYKHLITPIATDLQQSNIHIILFSLDDALRYLPIAALHNGDAYLVEHYGVALYSAAIGLNDLTLKPPKNAHIIAFGVTQQATVIPPSLNQQSYYFPALPYVTNELQGIVSTEKTQGIITGKYYLDQHVTKKALIKAFSSLKHTATSSSKIVHLATHFQLTAGNGYQSFLLLGNKKTFSLDELYHHPEIDFSSVDLLTASACNTTMTTLQVPSTNRKKDFNFHAIAQRRGAEVESFATIVQQKGAKAVLASLWFVNDRSTSTLMQNFYRHWKKDNVSKITALQQAQKYFIAQGKNAEKPECSGVLAPGERCEDIHYPQFSHPYYWAAFMLMGNGL